MSLLPVGKRRNPSGDGEFAIWRVVGESKWMHIVDYRAWQVIPTMACSPRQFKSWVVAGEYVPGVYIAQTEPPANMLRFVFAAGNVSLNYNELKDFADILKIDLTGSRGSKASVLHAIAVNIAAADGLEGATAFADSVVAKLEAAVKPDVVVDELTEQAFDMLDPDEQKEFTDVREKLTKGRLEDRLARAKKRSASEMGTSGGCGSALGRGRGRGGKFWGRGRCGRGKKRTVDASPAKAELTPSAPSSSAAQASSSSSAAAASAGEVCYEKS